MTDRTTNLENAKARLMAHALLDKLLDDAKRSRIFGDTALTIHYQDGNPKAIDESLINRHRVTN